MRGPDGTQPTTPIAAGGGVGRRRVQAGLEPLADYYAGLAATRADEPK